MSRYPSYKSGFSSPQRGRLLYPQLWRGCVTALSPSLGATGSQLFDHSVYGNHGTLTNMEIASDWIVNEGKLALSFDGTNEVVSTSISSINGATAATLTGWIYKAVSGASTAGFGCGGGVNTNRFSTIWFSDGNFYTATEPTTGGGTYGYVAATNNGWIHFTAVFDGSGATNADRNKVYMNGLLRSQLYVGAMPSALGNVGPVLLGKDSSNRFCAGMLDDVRLYNRVLSQSEITTLAQRRGIAYETYRVPVVRGASVGPTYTLTAASGSFTLTGNAATLKASRKLTAATGTFALTGNASTLRAGRKLTAATGSHSLTGNAATLKASRKIRAATGTYTYTGNAADLVYTPTGGPDYTLSAATGSFTLTGNTAGLPVARKIVAANGTYSLTGNIAGLQARRKLTAAAGSYTLTGQAAGLRASRKITAATGSYVMTGRAASLVYSGASGSRASFYYYLMLGS